ncbi:MAG TPA: pyridoxal-phosphate dependent enzyme [Myxococcales bacterium]
MNQAFQAIDLEELWRTLRPRVVPATLIEPRRINAALGGEIRVLLVSETFQHTGSFKFRAATSVALHSPAAHLLTASSGNFGAALAWAARETGKRCTVVMPAQSAQVKIDAVRSAGAAVELIDTAKISRSQRVEQLQDQDPKAQVVSPYDDPHVVAGNSSLAAELFARETPDCIIAPVGGGGLSSGIVVARDFLGVSCPVIGAEPALANDAARSLREGNLCRNALEPDTLCDGARTLSLGKLNFEILREGLSSMIEVEEAQVVRAVKMLFELANLKAEPTGALSVAAMLQSPTRFAGKRVACVISGGNIDNAVFTRLLVGNGS